MSSIVVKSSRFTGFITEHNAAYQWPTTHFVPIGESKTLCGLEIEKRPVDAFGFEQDINQGDEPSCLNCLRVFRSRKEKAMEETRL